MATNLFFNNYGASQEQTLYEDLIIESIQMYGVDVYYIPRTPIDVDSVFKEPEYSSYDTALSVEMYIKSVNGFEGDGEFLSKFGIQVRDQIVFTMAQRTFANEIGDYTSLMRPKEGDLVWFPFTQALYQIKYTDVKAIFYQLGTLQTYDITCELYEGNSDKFNTGLSAIDDKYNALSLDIVNFGLLAETGNQLVTEAGFELILESVDVEDYDPQAENDAIEKAADDIIDFTEFDPFSEGERA
jgi:hypothetical protein